MYISHSWFSGAWAVQDASEIGVSSRFSSDAETESAQTPASKPCSTVHIPSEAMGDLEKALSSDERGDSLKTIEQGKMPEPVVRELISVPEPTGPVEMESEESESDCRYSFKGMEWEGFMSVETRRPRSSALFTAEGPRKK